MNYRVLLAEADEQDRMSIHNRVQTTGCACDSVDTGEAALKQLFAVPPGHYAFVLLDVDSEKVDGISIAEQFRRSERPDAGLLPIVGISRETNIDVYRRAITACFNTLVLKPLTKECLQSFVTCFISNRRSSVLFQKVALEIMNNLQDERDRAREAERAKSYFFSSVSHDIRTPLNAIIGFSQMLKIGFSNEKEREEAIDSIIVSGKTLLQLVNDILDLSKLDAGQMPIEPEPTDCARLVNEIVESFRVANAKKNVDIRGVVGQIPVLLIDPQRLRQILFNLVGNAIKFTEKGFVEVRVTHSVDEVGDITLDLVVEDTGCGIPYENQYRVAQPYVQFSDGKKRGGTGLGLAICRQLVKAMDGKIEFSSKPGIGTKFYVTINHVKNGEAVRRSRMSATQRMQVFVPERDLFKGYRVLVADDSAINLAVMRAMLTRLGIETVTTVSTGEDALKELGEAKVPYDMLMTDMWMPGLNGGDLVRLVKADPRLAQLPVYAVTADTETQKSYAKMGFAGILLKPITFESLKNLVMEATGHHDGT